MSSKNKKKSLGKVIKWLVVIALALLIIVPLSINKVRHDYSLASKLPVSQTTKTRAFWLSIDEDKLEKLKESKKIGYFHTSSNDINIALVDDGYVYSFLFNRNGMGLSHISVESIDSTPGNKARIIFNTDGIKIDALLSYGNSSIESTAEGYREISDEEIDELTKNGLKLYNQFIKDYENL